MRRSSDWIVRGRPPALMEHSSRMDRRPVLAVGIYAALVLSLATPLYVPLGSGRDDSWALLILVAAAHLGLGAAIRRAWVLALPVALTIVAFLGAGADGSAWLA